jgi:Zn-dependent protease
MARGTTTRPRRRQAWRIGRVAGIDLRIHPTFLIHVAHAVLRAFGPPVSGLAWLTAVFGSVVVHELAHSLVAKRRHIPVHDIVLLPIGGVSEVERLPDHPGDELAVAIVGPLTSFAVAGISAATLLVSGGRLFPIDLTNGAFVHRLTWVNVMLGAFNLLPAFPLDGGRVLRALLAARHGLERATRSAASLGRALAVVIGVIGIFADAWLLLIAAFVYFGSRAEEAATIMHVRLAGRRVRDVMIAATEAEVLPALAPAHVRADDGLEEAVEAVTTAGATAATVHDGTGAVVGVLLLEDVAHLIGNR